MKRRLFSAIVVAAIALAAGIISSQSKEEVELTDLAMSNVEAIARVNGCFLDEKTWSCTPMGDSLGCAPCDWY